MKRRYSTKAAPTTEKCDRCGADVELDFPIVNGDDNDFSRMQGECPDCGKIVERTAEEDFGGEYEPDCD